MNGPDIQKFQKPISSEEIRQNFRHEKKERYMGLKLLVGLAILMFILLIYQITKSKSPGVENNRTAAKASENSNSLSSNDTNLKFRDKLSNVADTNLKHLLPVAITPAANPNAKLGANKNLHLSVYAKDLNTLRQKLKRASEKMMAKDHLRPVNATLNLDKFTFYCDFQKVNANESFKLLSLLWGPLAIGCESCLSALGQNPGSEVVVNGSDQTFDYNVIAIR